MRAAPHTRDTRGAVGRRAALAAALAALGAFAGPAHGQTPVIPPLDPARAPRPVVRDGAELSRERAALGEARELHDPLLTSPVRAPRPQLTAVASSANKVAKAQVGFVQERGWGSVQVLADASAPLASADDRTVRTTVADLSDLGGVSTGGVALRFVRWRRPSAAQALRAESLYLAAVDRLARDLRRRLPDTPPADRARLQADLDRLLRGNDKCPPVCSVVEPNNPVLNDPQYAALVGADAREVRALEATGTPFIFGVSGKGGRQTYAYRDAATLASDSRTLSDWQLRAAAGAFVPAVALVSVAYTRQQTARQQDSVQLCTPVDGVAGALRCDAARVGAPTLGTRDLVSVEVRRAFGASFAAAAEVTRDVRARVTRWQVPFYFLTDDQRALNGGVALGGQTGQGGVRVTVFVGAVAAPVLRRIGG